VTGLDEGVIGEDASAHFAPQPKGPKAARLSFHFSNTRVAPRLGEMEQLFTETGHAGPVVISHSSTGKNHLKLLKSLVEAPHRSINRTDSTFQSGRRRRVPDPTAANRLLPALMSRYSA